VNRRPPHRSTVQQSHPSIIRNNPQKPAYLQGIRWGTSPSSPAKLWPTAAACSVTPNIREAGNSLAHWPHGQGPRQRGTHVGFPSCARRAVGISLSQSHMLGEKVTLGTLSATVGRQPERINPLLFACAKTVSEGHLFQPRSLLVERKQIPQIVVIVGTWRKPMAPLEITRLPWAQGGRAFKSPRPDQCFQ
jgi:hypothetical protein